MDRRSSVVPAAQDGRGERHLVTMSILQLSADDVWTALDDVNLVELLANELTRKPADRDHDRPPRLAPWTRGTGEEFVLLEEPDTLLPAAILRWVRIAALSALAARLLVNTGVITAAVFGTGLAMQFELNVVTRWVPGISHVAVHVSGGSADVPVEERTLDQLELAGISLSIADDAAEAVFGANLVIVLTAGALEHLGPAALTKGAVLVNATDRDLPDELLDGVDDIFVDDARLLEADPRRTAPRQAGRVRAELGAVLAGTHQGRSSADDVVLVELLGAGGLDVWIADKIRQVALRRGLGTWVPGSR
jgi:ornithine cyclodeaminase/alanine dehydrogenase-like protein (mu-crystallin family)